MNINYEKNSNEFNPRNHIIDTITIHCFVGQVTAKQGVDLLAIDDEKSANYVIGYDGSIGINIPEKYRSWCSSNKDNDCRAVTIEVASDKTSPYAVTSKAYESLISLCADICQRNNIKKLIWSDNKYNRINHYNGCNMTVHRDFSNKECPGEYLYNRMGNIAFRVNSILNNSTVNSTNTTPYLVKVTTSALNIRKGAGTNYEKTGCIRDYGVYTIVQTVGNWGKLKSGVGWICLDYTKKV